jgi:hypothetical protein
MNQTETPQFAAETKPYIGSDWNQSRTDQPEKKRNWFRIIGLWTLFLLMSFIFWVGIITIADYVYQSWNEGII